MDRKKPKILVFIRFYLPGYKGGGPIKTIRNLIDKTSQELSYKLVTSDRDLYSDSRYDSIIPGKWKTLSNSEVFYSEPGPKGTWQIINILAKETYDLIYLNSFFSIRFSFLPLFVAKVLRQRVVLGPRGEFSQGALNIKPIRKRVFISFFRTLRFHKSTVFQASTNFEANDIRKIFGESVNIKVAEDIGSNEFAEFSSIQDRSHLFAVFVSRISPKKNLLGALEILKLVKNNIYYHIYGPIEDIEYWKQCKRVIETLPNHVQVEYKGDLDPSDVVPTLSGYDVFFFPTQGENYGHVITEALCAGLPLLISNTTPWRELEDLGIGWDFSLDCPNAFSETLDKLTTISSSEYFEKRKYVLNWAINRFSKDDAIRENIALFQSSISRK